MQARIGGIASLNLLLLHRIILNLSKFRCQNGPPHPRKALWEGWPQEAPCETYPREKSSPQKMREDHRLSALNSDCAYALCQTSERRFKIVSARQRVLQGMCPHTNVVGVRKG